MARCISMHSDKEEWNAAEAKVAACLQRLPDEFAFRWGHYYHLEGTGGEGDFLVFGPGSALLVLEVKGGAVTYDPKTRQYATNKKECPLIQRDRVCRGVVRAVQKEAQKCRLTAPYIHRGLGLPDVRIPHDGGFYQEMPREGILDANDLENFSLWWEKNVLPLSRVKKESEAAVKEMVFSLYFSELRGGATKRDLDFVDRSLERMSAAQYELLDALEENPRLAFSGGPGTGKTWLLFEQAFRWAKEGKRVLFLTYNLGLEVAVRALMGRSSAGQIDVYSYESLARQMYEKAGETFPEVKLADRAEVSNIFNALVPRLLREVVGKLGDGEKYDALVVDEAQDHDTEYHPEVGADERNGGWWEIYRSLLRGEPSLAIGYDVCQRHFARDASKFEIGKIAGLFPGLCKVRLRNPVRYTHSLIEYFRRLEDADTREILRDMKSGDEIVAGESPIFEEAGSDAEEKSAVGRLLAGWCKNAYERCAPQEVLILYPTSRFRPKWMDSEKINGIPLARAGVSGVLLSSIQKAKGLESRAVIVVGFPAWEKLGKAPFGAKVSFVLGVTRARQLLGVVQRTDIAPELLSIS